MDTAAARGIILPRLLLVHDLTPTQESSIVGHSIAVAEKHYSEYEAKEARALLPPDPLTNRTQEDRDAGSDADLAAETP